VSALLEIQDLSKSFGGVQAVTKVSFDVPNGEIMSVIGPNGAGKTTVLNMISGFYHPDHGRIMFEGREITHLAPSAVAALRIARTFQNIALFRGMTVLDNIKLGRHAHMRTNLLDGLFYWGRAQREEIEIRQEIEEKVIDFLEINHIRNQPVASLAYGLRKRVELARALAMKPKVLMLDEPVAGMNREETEDMARFILDVKEEWGVTILMVEHDMGLVMDISDHVVVLNFGQVIGRGRPEQVTANEEVIKAYLGAGDIGQLKARIAGEAA
jgi:branched-chain amino acid transport system ATP-binding protein